MKVRQIKKNIANVIGDVNIQSLIDKEKELNDYLLYGGTKKEKNNELTDEEVNQLIDEWLKNKTQN